jgi:hypothetical protein
LTLVKSAPKTVKNNKLFGNFVLTEKMLDFAHILSCAFLTEVETNFRKKVHIYGFFVTPSYFRNVMGKTSKKPRKISKMVYKYKLALIYTYIAVSKCYVRHLGAIHTMVKTIRKMRILLA